MGAFKIKRSGKEAHPQFTGQGGQFGKLLVAEFERLEALEAGRILARNIMFRAVGLEFDRLHPTLIGLNHQIFSCCK